MLTACVLQIDDTFDAVIGGDDWVTMNPSGDGGDEASSRLTNSDIYIFMYATVLIPSVYQDHQTQQLFYVLILRLCFLPFPLCLLFLIQKRFYF